MIKNLFTFFMMFILIGCTVIGSQPVLSFKSIKALSFFRNKEHVKYIEKFLNPTDIPYVKDKNSAKLYQEYSISAIKKMGANVEETEDSTKQLRKYRIVY